MKSPRIQPQLLKGFQDHLPEEMIARTRVIDVIKNVYERFGFVQIETPALERLDTLTGSAGADINKEIFRLQTPEQEDAALRFDLTVPFARVVSQYREHIKLPFRRFHIGSVFRADKPGPGRFRQFTQFDVDIAGARSLAADAEIIAVMCAALRAVGLEEGGVPLFKVRISNRRLVDALLAGSGVSDTERVKHTLRVVDKLRKVGLDNVRLELGPGRVDDSGDPIPGVQLQTPVIDTIVRFIDVSGSSRNDVIDALSRALPDTPESATAIAEMNELAGYLDALGLSEAEAVYDPSLTRGLDYYTGPVYEVEITALAALGSIGAGGRYNELCGRFLSQDIPAAGASIGLDRLMAALSALNKLDYPKSVAQVCIATVGKVPTGEVLRLATELRAAGFNTVTYLGGKKNMAAQLSDADRYEIPVAVILGEEELQRGEVAVKDLIAGKRVRENIDDHDAYRQAGTATQVTVRRGDMIDAIRGMLEQRP